MKRVVDVPKLLERLGISAKQRDDEMWACCPFHKEKEPSWQIRNEPCAPEHGLWRCFGCGVSGNVVQLIAATFGLSYGDAQRWMRSEGFAHDVPLPVSIDVVVQKFKRFRLPVGIKFDPIAQWLSEPKKYVLKRGVLPSQIIKWRIGYANEGKLRGRIVFPIFNVVGEPVSYTGRTYVESGSRYKNPDSEEEADLGAIWGEHTWPLDIEDRELLIVGEGAFNALAIERALVRVPSINESVFIGALFGSNVHVQALAKLSTWKRIMVASDNDQAGDKMWNALQSLGKHVKLSRVLFPPKIDANAFGRDNLVMVLDDAYNAFGSI